MAKRSDRFYLGRLFDFKKGEVTAEPLMYASAQNFSVSDAEIIKDRCVHGHCVCSGSGTVKIF